MEIRERAQPRACWAVFLSFKIFCNSLNIPLRSVTSRDVLSSLDLMIKKKPPSARVCASRRSLPTMSEPRSESAIAVDSEVTPQADEGGKGRHGTRDPKEKLQRQRHHLATPAHHHQAGPKKKRRAIAGPNASFEYTQVSAEEQYGPRLEASQRERSTPPRSGRGALTAQAAAEQEGLTLEKSTTGQGTGYRNVIDTFAARRTHDSYAIPADALPYQAYCFTVKGQGVAYDRSIPLRGNSKYVRTEVGRFATAAEAALALARHVKQSGVIQRDERDMTTTEAEAAARAEGLELVLSDKAGSGYLGVGLVSISGRGRGDHRARPFYARVAGRKSCVLGQYASRVTAALALARYYRAMAISSLGPSHRDKQTAAGSSSSSSRYDLPSQSSVDEARRQAEARREVEARRQAEEARRQVDEARRPGSRLALRAGVLPPWERLSERKQASVASKQARTGAGDLGAGGQVRLAHRMQFTQSGSKRGRGDDEDADVDGEGIDEVEEVDEEVGDDEGEDGAGEGGSELDQEAEGLKAHPLWKYSLEAERGSASEEEVLRCSICLDGFIGPSGDPSLPGGWGETSCGHCHHYRCLSRWLASQEEAGCPQCRHAVSKSLGRMMT